MLLYTHFPAQGILAQGKSYLGSGQHVGPEMGVITPKMATPDATHRLKWSLAPEVAIFGIRAPVFGIKNLNQNLNIFFGATH